MKKNLGPKNYIYPLPVLIVGTYGEDGTPDAMNRISQSVASIPEQEIIQILQRFPELLVLFFLDEPFEKKRIRICPLKTKIVRGIHKFLQTLGLSAGMA